MTDLKQQTLAGIVTNNHRAATVFEKYNLDFCCKGKRTLADACAEKGISAIEIEDELESIIEREDPLQMPFNEMTAEQLIAHIVTRHHFYVKKTMPPLFEHLERVATKHGDRFPYMIEVFQLFAAVKNEMTTHMQKEEMILFPAIKRAEAAVVNKTALGNEAAIIRGATHVMETEHDAAGNMMQQIRKLTGNYTAPIGACTTFRLSLAELQAFEEDLHQHVHLENNILFPMAKRSVEGGEFPQTCSVKIPA